MSRTISNLVDADLVARDIDSENRRYISLQLTEKGIEVFKNIEESMNDYYSSIFSSIPDNKREQVLESLQILVQSVKDKKSC